ncbi:hypothetical protein AVEN_239117-1 [Araneus ventricosus]|uniref:Uncharacterized protein n=1 Tax=Araneus ventricosus TaxID=182803 RepID=A0A4Y2QDD8_ARAVE|nr:hypothetical protein AVEN_239117-1 [Araneus ventricosus]
MIVEPNYCEQSDKECPWISAKIVYHRVKFTTEVNIVEPTIVNQRSQKNRSDQCQKLVWAIVLKLQIEVNIVEPTHCEHKASQRTFQGLSVPK